MYLVFKDFAKWDIQSMVGKIVRHTPQVTGYPASIASFFGGEVKGKIATYGKCILAQKVCELDYFAPMKKYIFVLEFERSYMLWSFNVYHGADGWYFKGFAIDDPEDEKQLVRQITRKFEGPTTVQLDESARPKSTEAQQPP